MYSYNTLYNNEKEQTTAMCNNVDDSYRYNVDPKKPQTKEYIIYIPFM